MSKKACKDSSLSTGKKKGLFRCEKCNALAKNKKDLCKPTKIAK